MKIKVTGKQIAEKLGIDISKYPESWPDHGHGTISPRKLLSEKFTYEFEEEEYKKLSPVKKGLFSGFSNETGEIYDAGYSTENLYLGKAGKKDFAIVIGGDTASQGCLTSEY